MAADALAPEVTVWTDGEAAPRVGRLLEAMVPTVRPIGVGGPRVAGVDALAKQFSCARADDLRKLVIDKPAAFLLIGSMREAAGEDLLAAAAQDTTILSLCPLAADFGEFRDLTPHPAAGSGNGRGDPPRYVFLGGFTQSPAFLRVADPFETLDDQRLVAFESSGPRADAPLHTRLFDAWRTMLAFTDLPESIDAALGGGELPDTLGPLHGRLTAHARLAGAGSGVLHVTDTVAHPCRSLHVVADTADLRVSTRRYRLQQIDGTLLDAGEIDDGQSEPEALRAAHWRRLLDRPDLAGRDATAQRQRDVLACCLASLLSARTGQPESPGKLIEMNR